MCLIATVFVEHDTQFPVAVGQILLRALDMEVYKAVPFKVPTFCCFLPTCTVADGAKLSVTELPAQKVSVKPP